MDEQYRIEYVEDPEESAWGIIGRNLGQYNRNQAGDDHFQHLCFVVQAPDQEIVGGVLGEVYWNWLFVKLMWVKDSLRGQGYGRRLLTLLEEAARQQGAKNAFLDTFSFQAPDFYQHLGYQVFGELEDYPDEHRRYFLKKRL